MTALIVAATFVSFLRQPPDEPTYVGLAAAAASAKLAPRTAALFVSYCRGRQLPSASCQDFSALVTMSIPDLRLLHDQAYQLAFAKRIQSLNQALQNVKRNEPLFPMLATLDDFAVARARPDRTLKRLTSYPAYQAARGAYLAAAKKLLAREGAFSRLTPKPVAALRTMLLHGGWLHLIGNLLAFIAFGIFVECRASRPFYLACYVIGGFIAAYAFLAGTDPAHPEVPLVGASGAIAAVIGMFYVFFWKAEMGFMLPFPHPRALVRLPVKYALPMFLIGPDLIAQLSSAHAFAEGDHIGHLAHIGGFAFGAAAAWLADRVRPVRWPFLYACERADTAALAAPRNPRDLIRSARKILAYNRDNFVAKGRTISALLRQPPTEAAAAFIHEHLQGLCAVLLAKRQPEMVYTLLRSLPPDLPLEIYLDRLGQINTLALADHALRHKDTPMAGRLLDSFLQRFPATRYWERVKESRAALLASPASDAAASAVAVAVGAEPAPASAPVAELTARPAVTLAPGLATSRPAVALASGQAVAPASRSAVALAPGQPVVPSSRPAAALARTRPPSTQTTRGPRRLINGAKLFHGLEEDPAFYPPPAPLDRLGAFFVDMTLVGATVEILKLPFSGLILQSHYDLRHPLITALIWGITAAASLPVVVIPLSRTGQTPGKRAFGIRVITKDEGLKLSLLQIVVRETLGKWLSALPFLLGFVGVIAGERKRCLHDYLAGTRVIQYRKSKTSRWRG